MILILMGKMAVGKDTILKQLVSNYGFTPIISDTTRPVRDGETNGVEYNFITLDEFKNRTYMETRHYKSGADTWHYGMPVNDEYSDPSKDYVVVVDTYGAKEIVDVIGRDNCVIVHLTATDTNRWLRASARSPITKEEWDTRYADDEERFSRHNVYSLTDLEYETIKPIDIEAREIAEIYKKRKADMHTSSRCCAGSCANCRMRKIKDQ